MPTTFAIAYKNKVIDTLTGRASTTNVLRYVRPYDGTQPASPSDTPVGVAAYTTVTGSIDVNGFMSQPGIGVTQLAQAKATAAGATTGTLTFARIYDAGQAAMIDCTVGTSGTPGVILDAASASNGTNLAATAMTYKFPQSLSTISLNTDLVNAMVSALWVTAANVGLGISSVINVYSGTAPATADTPLSGNTLLVTFTIGATSAWLTASAGSAALTSNMTGSGLATGTATFARVVKGALIMQGTVGTSGADFILDTVSIVTSNTITLNEATIAL